MSKHLQSLYLNKGWYAKYIQKANNCKKKKNQYNFIEKITKDLKDISPKQAYMVQRAMKGAQHH